MHYEYTAPGQPSNMALSKPGAGFRMADPRPGQPFSGKGKARQSGILAQQAACTRR